MFLIHIFLHMRHVHSSRHACAAYNYERVWPERTCMTHDELVGSGGRPTSTYLLARLLDLREQVVIRDRARDEDLLLLEADLVLADAYARGTDVSARAQRPQR
jgi:hypothetical protein